MTLWLTSDLHFGHANILRYCPNRGLPDIAAMDEFLVQAWNDTVDSSDDVLVVGDVCMGNLKRSLSLIGRLHGRSIRLLTGNHDKPFRRDGVPRPDWERRYLDAGFSEILHGTITLDIGLGRPVLVCHFPYRGDSQAQDRYLDCRPVDDGSTPLLHGHTHGRARRAGRMVDVGVDAWGGRPVAVEEIAALLRSPVDHADPLPWPTAGVRVAV
jgi:calcineurin-like phosphoesterase family protein